MYMYVSGKNSKLPFRRIAISLILRTRPVMGSVKTLVSRFPSKYNMELQLAKNQSLSSTLIMNNAERDQGSQTY